MLAAVGCSPGETEAQGPILSPPQAPSHGLWLLGTNLGFIWGKFWCVQSVDISLPRSTPAVWPAPQFPSLHSCPGVGVCTEQLGKGKEGKVTISSSLLPPQQPRRPRPSMLLIEPRAGGGAEKRGRGRRAARGRKWCEDPGLSSRLDPRVPE